MTLNKKGGLALIEAVKKFKLSVLQMFILLHVMIMKQLLQIFMGGFSVCLFFRYHVADEKHQN